MITKETEASRFNDGKVRYSLIDFSMFNNMHKYFNFTSDVDTKTKCIEEIIMLLSNIVKKDDNVAHQNYIPWLQALGYKLSLLYSNIEFNNSIVYDLRAFESMAKVLEYGANKYELNNWRKGYTNKFSSIDSLYRHLREVIIGNDLDEESGLPHIGHIMCNIMFLTNDLLYIERVPVGNEATNF